MFLASGSDSVTEGIRILMVLTKDENIASGETEAKISHRELLESSRASPKKFFIKAKQVVEESSDGAIQFRNIQISSGDESVRLLEFLKREETLLINCTVKGIAGNEETIYRSKLVIWNGFEKKLLYFGDGGDGGNDKIREIPIVLPSLSSAESFLSYLKKEMGFDFVNSGSTVLVVEHRAGETAHVGVGHHGGRGGARFQPGDGGRSGRFQGDRFRGAPGFPPPPPRQLQQQLYSGGGGFGVPISAGYGQGHHEAAWWGNNYGSYHNNPGIFMSEQPRKRRQKRRRK